MPNSQRLLTEIERDLLDGKPLADLLRKCVLLGGRSGSVELRDWATKELKGYEGAKDDEIPPYRTVHAAIMLDGVTPASQIKGQRISATVLPDFVQKKFSEEITMYQSVGELEAMVQNVTTGEALHISLPMAAEICRLMNTDNPGQTITSLYWAVSIVSIHGILDNLRTTLTELISELVGIMPENQETPTPDQANQAIQVAFHGKASNVSINTSQASSGSISSATHSPTETTGDLDPAWWTLGRKIGAFVVGVAVILGAIFAYMALYR
ncbi:AbiTii domain-containing protein [Rhodococcus qingshengii]|uniref:AbiTii domain-containing protein n=1 Tax=Rhodococcus qingshengii TaxID=334542 RepID=UPI001BEBCA18|nr:hypothetical protein [Rhodococcus qingshengii]MBT2270671.1 hypothetical protein [Rhodococcus qingshengii]